MERPLFTSQLSRFSCIKEWPEPQSVAFLETLAKDDIDTAVQLILCREKFIVKKIDTYLDHQDTLTTRRRELLYRKWVSNVRDPLQQKIIEKVSTSRNFSKKKQEEFESYLEFINKTGAVFFDHYIPGVYDPYYMKNKDPEYFKVTVPLLHDPLFQARQIRDEENRALLQCETGKRYTMRKFRELEKSKLMRLPPFSFGQQDKRPKSEPANREHRPKSSMQTKLGSVGRRPPPARKDTARSGAPSPKQPPTPRPGLEDIEEKKIGSVTGLDLLMAASLRHMHPEAEHVRVRLKASDVWAHRPLLLKSATWSGGHKLRPVC
ncbi:protein FAM228B-like isoform X1 [Monodelphis domestica]|uniref:protein FAM228B-like isoform X1 n=1 Tax=Monodelphis domestica TaxID=13616 RepID=UPI0024E1FE99|nr:protein FAM228B-like isoform X1 [Monodelphis domestica]